MWSIVRSAAARQLRVSHAVKQATTPSSLIPGVYRLTIASKRIFSETSGEQLRKSAASAEIEVTTKTTTKSKKPAAEKKSKAATTRSVAAKKPKAEKKEKAAAVKTEKKKRAKRALTPEEKFKQEIRELKKAALLAQPKLLPTNKWLLYFREHLLGQPTPDATREVAAAYNKISASEIERLEALAAKNRVANEAANKAWAESHTPKEIDAANRARRRLWRVAKVGSPLSKVKLIRDKRLPVKPIGPYTLYHVQRFKSGDFLTSPASDAAKIIGQEWRALSDAQRQTYAENAVELKEKYRNEVRELLHRELYEKKPAASAPSVTSA